MQNRLTVLAGAAALIAGGCALDLNRQAGHDPYAAAIYTGAKQVDAADHYATLYAPDTVSQNGAPFEIASYAGIDGARRAHERYTDEDAEALDGRCERYVEASAAESLIDIANLCDVPLDMLVGYNPEIGNVSYTAPGAIVEIPGGSVAPRGAFAMSAALAELYAVQEGDTLEKIAWRLNASPAAIANLNPEVYWPDLTAGQLIRKSASAPVSGPPSSPTSSYAPYAAAPAWQGYNGGAGIGGSDAPDAVDPAALAPYALTPVKSYGRALGAYPEARLTVSKKFVNAGDSVEVTARAAPGTDVTFYSGDEPGDLKKSRTVTADENGNATASIRVKKKSNMGGVVFGARPAGSNETQFSDRVNVVRLKDPALAAPTDEDEAEETDTE